MPFQAWTEFITCPLCFKVFNEKQQRPISLFCGHTVCKSCLKQGFNDRRCPFDQKDVTVEDIDRLPANFTLMNLIGAAVSEQEKEVVTKEADDPECYKQARQCIEDMAVHLKPLVENASDDENDATTDANSSPASGSNKSPSNKLSHCVLSRPMQRKLISLIHCQLFEEESRSRAARIARSLGERIVSELLILHQFPHQLSANLWAAVRTRGCQFLGPAMQEEVLKLILLALEDGSYLSRKVLVLFVVQRLEARYPQASKTAIGHVVQLLYRASCFKVIKREEESSLMQLKEEFRQYESLRREHDSQIVQIATEAGLRISPEQWSSLLYGDSAHKSHMQSIIDKHQTPQSFAQTLSELMMAIQRTGDPSKLHKMNHQLEFLSKIDPSPDCPAPSWENLEAIMQCLKTAVNLFVDFVSNNDQRQRLEATPLHNARYKTSKCRDYAARGTCPRGNTCTFAHSQEELERYRSRSRRSGQRGGLTEKTSSSLTPSESDQLRQIQLLSRLKLEGEYPTSYGLTVLGDLSRSELSSDRDVGFPSSGPVSPVSEVEKPLSKSAGPPQVTSQPSQRQSSLNAPPTPKPPMPGKCGNTTEQMSRPPMPGHCMNTAEQMSRPPMPGHCVNTAEQMSRHPMPGHCLNPEQAPFFPQTAVPKTQLTFSKHDVDGNPNIRSAQHPVRQTDFHPNSKTFFPHGPQSMGHPPPLPGMLPMNTPPPWQALAGQAPPLTLPHQQLSADQHHHQHQQRQPNPCDFSQRVRLPADLSIQTASHPSMERHYPMSPGGGGYPMPCGDSGPLQAGGGVSVPEKTFGTGLPESLVPCVPVPGQESEHNPQQMLPIVIQTCPAPPTPPPPLPPAGLAAAAGAPMVVTESLPSPLVPLFPIVPLNHPPQPSFIPTVPVEGGLVTLAAGTAFCPPPMPNIDQQQNAVLILEPVYPSGPIPFQCSSRPASTVSVREIVKEKDLSCVDPQQEDVLSKIVKES